MVAAALGEKRYRSRGEIVNGTSGQRQGQAAPVTSVVSATTPLGPAADAYAPPQRELVIIFRDHYVQYEGTAAQIEAEGVIPKNFEWPEADRSRYWSANNFRHWARRMRPEGHKGSKRSWLELDSWFVRVEVEGHDLQWRAAETIRQKEKELRDAIYRQSFEGRRKESAECERMASALADKPFRGFLANLLPERKKPGRKPGDKGLAL